jgi:hypothetical protein
VPLSPEGRAALNALLPPDQQTGDLRTDLRAAFAESRRRREENSENGGRIIAELHAELQSWELTAEELDEPITTLRRWSQPYRQAGDDA